jgi:hypothetical protein
MRYLSIMSAVVALALAGPGVATALAASPHPIRDKLTAALTLEKAALKAKSVKALRKKLPGSVNDLDAAVVDVIAVLNKSLGLGPGGFGAFDELGGASTADLDNLRELLDAAASLDHKAEKAKTLKAARGLIHQAISKKGAAENLDGGLKNDYSCQVAEEPALAPPGEDQFTATGCTGKVKTVTFVSPVPMTGDLWDVQGDDTDDGPCTGSGSRRLVCTMNTGLSSQDTLTVDVTAKFVAGSKLLAATTTGYGHYADFLISATD